MLRSKRWHRIVLSAVVATTVHAQPTSKELTLPDPATGSINGRSALLFWPVLSTSNPDEPKLLPVQGCQVHLVPQDDPAVEHRYPCGSWFQPPKGRYNMWLETSDRISVPSMVIYAGGPSKAGTAALVPMHPGGRVAIQPNRPLRDGEDLRLLSLDSHVATTSGRIFERRVRREDAAGPVLMPVGRVVVGRFDAKTGDAVALTRPVSVTAGNVVRVWPEPPSGKSDLLVVLAKPPRTPGSAETQLFADDGERRLPPDVLLDVNRVIGIWYGIDARNVTISLRAAKMAWPNHETRLAPGRVTTIRARAEPPPKLNVLVTAPDGATLPENLRAIVQRLDDERTVGTALITAAVAHEFAELAPAPHRVTLEVGDWKLVRDVDLSSGRDGEASFELEPITISGNVFLGDDPVAAELRFHNRGEWVSVSTDERGTYRATLWHPGYYTLRIAVARSKRAPFTQHFTRIDESGRRDFRLPLTNYTLTVRDADSGAPIAGATVGIGNVWPDETLREQSLLDTLRTDDSGTAILPPLRAGRLFVTAEKDGYVKGTLERSVLDGDRNPHQLVMFLRQPRASHRLRILAPDGQPLAGAEIWAFAGGDLTTPLWQVSTGEGGAVDVAEAMENALFLIRHQRAATAVRRWTAGANDVVEWRMEAPAPALVASIRRPGDLPARSARIALWLDGTCLSDAPLAFATWSSPAADMHGSWIARNLPHRPVRLLAIPLGSSSPVDPRALESMATTVTFPWTASAAIRTVE